MNIPFFDLTRQTISLQEELDSAYGRVLKSGRYIGGEEVERFEHDFAQYLGANHCVSCANGTDAIEMSLEVLGIGPGDEVILPAFGWISGKHAVQRAEAIPVFVDVEGHTGNMDVSLIEAAITPKTKAIMPTHLYGKPCAIVELRNICDKNQLYLVEDCAQAHGAEVEGRKVGNFGDLSVFSFYPTKNLGCFGDGGALVTNNGDLAESLRRLKNYGKDSAGSFTQPGRNSRLDELQAAILNVKLSYLDQWNSRRKEIASSYSTILSNNLLLDSSNSVNYQFVLNHDQREVFRSHLAKSGVSTELHYNFILNSSSEFPNAAKLSEQVMSLPVFPELTTQELSYICEQLKQI
ncbi:DegT/DnrJ/EryC1/StrS family aminotransferase [Marinoscillum pacificum]|uniref:DegT/DnrJ/EryC1/StrS family aminotransferase n=1 Tax=Marinoscillum pacificum TaxID=392723 RepID=UPI0021582825|nr:DegT/DnrJ/EryC1/StrS family aminotransferase [Marinoscillum pacificum]